MSPHRLYTSTHSLHADISCSRSHVMSHESSLKMARLDRCLNVLVTRFRYKKALLNVTRIQSLWRRRLLKRAMGSNRALFIPLLGGLIMAGQLLSMHRGVTQDIKLIQKEHKSAPPYSSLSVTTPASQHMKSTMPSPTHLHIHIPVTFDQRKTRYLVWIPRRGSPTNPNLVESDTCPEASEEVEGDGSSQGERRLYSGQRCTCKRLHPQSCL